MPIKTSCYVLSWRGQSVHDTIAEICFQIVQYLSSLDLSSMHSDLCGEAAVIVHDAVSRNIVFFLCLIVF